MSVTETLTSIADVDVPVVGGHAGITILPLFSQVGFFETFFCVESAITLSALHVYGS